MDAVLDDSTTGLGIKEAPIMTHKDVWNTIIHSSQIFEWGHPLHDLDKIVLWTVGFVFVICLAAVVQMERKFCRESRESRYEYSRWLRQWRKQQKEGRHE